MGFNSGFKGLNLICSMQTVIRLANTLRFLFKCMIHVGPTVTSSSVHKFFGGEEYFYFSSYPCESGNYRRACITHGGTR